MNEIFSQIKILIDEFWKNKNFEAFKNTSDYSRKNILWEKLEKKITILLKKLIEISKNLKDKTNGKICFDNDPDKLLATINSIFEETNNKLLDNRNHSILSIYEGQLIEIRNTISNEYHELKFNIEALQETLDKKQSYETINFYTSPEEIKLAKDHIIIATDNRKLYNIETLTLAHYLNLEKHSMLPHSHPLLDSNNQSQSSNLSLNTLAIVLGLGTGIIVFGILGYYTVKKHLIIFLLLTILKNKH